MNFDPYPSDTLTIFTLVLLTERRSAADVPKQLRAQRKNHDSWTCHRACDTSLIQLGFLIAMAFQIEDAWNDFAIPIGLDCRCPHCIIHLPVPRLCDKSDHRSGLKHWIPYLDREGKPGLLHISTCDICTKAWKLL